MIKKAKRGEKLIHVRNMDDFDKITELDKNVFHTVILEIDNDIDFSGIVRKPIDARGLNVIIRGKEKLNGRRCVFKGLRIDNKEESLRIMYSEGQHFNDRRFETGLFSLAKSFKIINVNVADSLVKGGVFTGTLVGTVVGEATVKDCGFTGRVDGEAYCGGLFGTTGKLVMENSIVMDTVQGKDFVGGVSGVVDSTEINNSNINSTIISNGRSLGNITGYNSAEMKPVVDQMLRQTMPLLKPRLTVEDREIVGNVSL